MKDHVKDIQEKLTTYMRKLVKRVTHLKNYTIVYFI